MPSSADSTNAPVVDGALHEPPELAQLQRQSEQATLFGCTTPRVPQASPSDNRIMRGSLVTIVGYGSGQVIRLAGNIVVSRLVLPEAFGIMALVNIMIQGLTMFSDIGIEPAIVQHRRGDEPRFYNTAWTVQVLRGLLLLIAACCLAWPAAQTYNEPRLLILLPVAAFASVIAGFNSTALFAVRRHLLLGRLTLLELISQLVGVGVMCLWAALVSAGAWAMIVGVFATTSVNLIGSHLLLSGYRNRFAWDPTAFDALFRFGRWVLVSTTITFCALQIDRLLLGRLISKETLGVYSVALAIALLPNMLLQTLAGTVLYPLLARFARRSPQDLNDNLAPAREILIALGMFFVVGVVLEANTFFALLYDERYGAAARIAQLLAASVWVSMLNTTLERVPQALGETRMLAAYNFVKLVSAAIAALAGFYWAGLDGFILGYTLGMIAGYLTLAYLLEQFQISVWRDDLRLTAQAALTTWMGISLTQFCASLFSDPLYSAIAREIAAWVYLGGVGTWAFQKARRLPTLST